MSLVGASRALFSDANDIKVSWGGMTGASCLWEGIQAIVISPKENGDEPRPEEGLKLEAKVMRFLFRDFMGSSDETILLRACSQWEAERAENYTVKECDTLPTDDAINTIAPSEASKAALETFRKGVGARILAGKLSPSGWFTRLLKCEGVAMAQLLEIGTGEILCEARSEGDMGNAELLQLVSPVMAGSTANDVASIFWQDGGPGTSSSTVTFVPRGSLGAGIIARRCAMLGMDFVLAVYCSGVALHHMGGIDAGERTGVVVLTESSSQITAALEKTVFDIAAIENVKEERQPNGHAHRGDSDVGSPPTNIEPSEKQGRLGPRTRRVRQEKLVNKVDSVYAAASSFHRSQTNETEQEGSETDQAAAAIPNGGDEAFSGRRTVMGEETDRKIEGASVREKPLSAPARGWQQVPRLGTPVQKLEMPAALSGVRAGQEWDEPASVETARSVAISIESPRDASKRGREVGRRILMADENGSNCE